MAQINIQFSLFSAFYTPLIATISGGFLKAQGLEANWSIATPDKSAIAAATAGEVHVIQSALSQGLTSLDKGEVPPVKHFAQINETDGFFIVGREADPDFSWKKLEGSEVVLFGGGQPLVMFKYACLKAGIDFDKIKAINVGGAAAMDAAFREGQGIYVQQQGPYPQALAAEGQGHILTEVGRQVGMCGFSSLAATEDWLQTDMATAFMRAYQAGREFVIRAPAFEVARSIEPFFKGADVDVLAHCIEAYKGLGCWTSHVDISEDAFLATQEIYQKTGGLQGHFQYDQVCCPPPVVES